VAPGKTADGIPYSPEYRAVFSGGADSLANAQPITLVAPKTVTANLAMPTLQAPQPTPPSTPSPTPPSTPTTRATQAFLPLVQR
jgi:hypothetical protein